MDELVTIEDLIGRNTRSLRKAKGWSQRELGNRVAFTLGSTWAPQQVSQAENGQRAFTAAEMVALAAALDVTVANLYMPPGDVEVTLPSGERLNPTELRALVHRNTSKVTFTRTTEFFATMNRIEELLANAHKQVLAQALDEGLLNPITHPRIPADDDNVDS